MEMTMAEMAFTIYSMTDGKYHYSRNGGKEKTFLMNTALSVVKACAKELYQN